MSDSGEWIGTKAMRCGLAGRVQGRVRVSTTLLFVGKMLDDCHPVTWGSLYLLHNSTIVRNLSPGDLSDVSMAGQSYVGVANTLTQSKSIPSYLSRRSLNSTRPFTRRVNVACYLFVQYLLGLSTLLYVTWPVRYCNPQKAFH